MSKAKAEEFIEKFYTDDEFAYQVIKEGRLYWRGDLDEEEDFAKAAVKVGYDITEEECDDANDDYLEKIGGREAFKKIIHLVKLARKVRKENKA